MNHSEILRHVEKLPLTFDDATKAYLDDRWLLSRDPATIVLNKSLVRRRISDIYAAISTDPWLARFAVLDEQGHIRIGPFQVLYGNQTRHMYLSFAKTAPIAAMYFVELTLAPQRVRAGGD